MSIGALDVIDRLPFELQARLEADEYFGDIPVVVAEEGNVAQELARKQAVITEKSGKRGVAVVVLQVLADDPYPNVAFGSLALRPAFQVVENVELNRDANGTGKSARQVARRIRDVIKPLRLAGLTTEFAPDRPCIEPVEIAGELGGVVKAYQVNFITYEADSEAVEMVSEPQFGQEGGAFTLSCATAGAEIWYSTDDSYPAPGRPGSAKYEGPVSVSGELTVRAAAFKAGLIGSSVARATIEIA